jgi:hypothetical protein
LSGRFGPLPFAASLEALTGFRKKKRCGNFLIRRV